MGIISKWNSFIGKCGFHYIPKNIGNFILKIFGILDNFTYLCSINKNRNIMPNIERIEKVKIVENGEVKLDVNTSTIVKKTKNTEQFIQVYLEDMKGMMGIDNGTHLKVLFLMWRDSQYNSPSANEGNIVTILKDDKEKWASEIGCSVKTINNAITALKTQGLLIGKARARYVLNPKFFFKGPIKERQQVIINYEVEYVPNSQNEFENVDFETGEVLNGENN